MQLGPATAGAAWCAVILTHPGQGDCRRQLLSVCRSSACRALCLPTKCNTVMAGTRGSVSAMQPAGAAVGHLLLAALQDSTNLHRTAGDCIPGRPERFVPA